MELNVAAASHLMESHNPTLFEGLTFLISQDIIPLFRGLNIISLIDSCGGKVVDFESEERGRATHVLGRHMRQQCCVWGQAEQKTLVTPFWVFECSEENRLLALEDPLYTPFPSEGIPGAAGCQVTLTGFQGPIRAHLLELLASTGVNVMRQMNPVTVTHVVTSDVNENTEKVNRARLYQAKRPGQISIVNCLWIYNNLRFWELQPTEQYLGNPDPEVDPARGQLAIKSLPSQLAEVPNSEDDDAEVPLGNFHPAMEATEKETTPFPGSMPVEDAPKAVPNAAAMKPSALPVTDAAAPSTGPQVDTRGALEDSRSGHSSGWRTRSHPAQAAPSTPATVAEPSPAAKENTAPRTIPASQANGNKSGSARDKRAMEPKRTNAGYASESQVQDYQVAAANAITSNLIAQLASGLPNSDPQPPAAHVSLLPSDARKSTGQCREAPVPQERDMPAHDKNADDPAATDEAAEVREPSQQRGDLKRDRQRTSEPAGAQPSKKRKLLSKADSAALGRAPKPTAKSNAQKAAPEREAPKKKAKSTVKSRAKATKPKEFEQHMEEAEQQEGHAGPSTGRASATPPTAQRRDVQKRPFVALSGLHTREIQKFSPMLESLGVSHTDGLEDQHVWNCRTTHWVAPKLTRTAKALSAMAAGAWLLSTSFITASAAARALVEPEVHELESGCKLVADGAPLHWRMRAKSLGHGAFQGLQVLVHGTFKTKVKPDRKDITSILSAGGATLVSLQEAVGQGADLAIIADGTSKNHVKELLKAKITCAKPEYIVEWIAHPDDSLTENLLHGSVESAKLAEVAKERSKCLEAEEQSCSF